MKKINTKSNEEFHRVRSVFLGHSTQFFIGILLFLCDISLYAFIHVNFRFLASAYTNEVAKRTYEYPVLELIQRHMEENREDIDYRLGILRLCRVIVELRPNLLKLSDES